MHIEISRQRLKLPLLPILAAIAFAALAVTATRVGRVQPGQLGVLVDNVSGRVHLRMEPGAVVYNGLITDFHLLDNSVQTLRLVRETGEEVQIKTDDGSDVTMDVEVNYRLMLDPEVLVRTVIPESGLSRERLVAAPARGRPAASQLVDAYKAKWVRDYARSVVRYAFGELDTKTFYNAEERDRRTHLAKDELNRLLNPHGIEIQQVVPDIFHFIEDFEKIIADTQAAEQEVESQMRKADAALQDQKRQEREAEALVQREIAAVQGELNKAVLVAEAEAARETKAAEAYAYTKQQQADAAFYQSRNQAQSLLAKAKAEAEGFRRLAGALAGDGATAVVKMEYAKVLTNALIRGLPYATDPRVQKVELSTPPASPATPADSAAGGKR